MLKVKNITILKKNISVLLWIIAVVCNFPVAAAMPPKEVAGIETLGDLEPETQQRLLFLFGYSKGDLFDKGRIRIGIKQVLASPEFMKLDVYAEETKLGLVLILKAQPSQRLSHVDIAGGGQFLASFERVLHLAAGDVFQKADLEKAKARLKKKAHELGYFGAEVSYELKPYFQNRYYLQFQITLFEQTKIDSLKLRGEYPYSLSKLTSRLNLGLEKGFNRLALVEKLQEVLKELYQNGFYDAQTTIEGVELSKDRTRASLKVLVDSGVAYGLKFNGIRSFVESSFRGDALTSLETYGLSERSRSQIRGQISTFYSRRGFIFSRVSIKTKVASKKEREKGVSTWIQVDVHEGIQTFVDEIRIRGSVFFPADVLKAEIQKVVYEETPRLSLWGLKENIRINEIFDTAGTLQTPRRSRWVQKSTALNKSHYALGMDHLLSLYKREGFLKVQISGPIYDFHHHHREVDVVYRIDEGPRYYIRTVKMDGKDGGPTLLKAAKEQFQDTPISVERIKKFLEETELAFGNQGYKDAKFLYELEKSEIPNGYDLGFRLHRGNRYLISDIDIVGNVQTKEKLVIDRLPLKKGDVFTQSAFELGKMRLLELDLYDRSDFDFLPEADGTYRMVVSLEEKSRHSVDLGIGMSLEEGPRVLAQYRLRNVFGLGVDYRLRGQVNYPAVFYGISFVYDQVQVLKLESRFKKSNAAARFFSLLEGKLVNSLVYPYVLNMPFETSMTLSLGGQRRIALAYTLNQIYLQASPQLQLLKSLRFIPQMRFEYAAFSCGGAFLGRGCDGASRRALSRRLDDGQLLQLSLQNSLMLDKRDNPFSPRHGYYLSGTFEVGLGNAELERPGDDNGEDPFDSRAVQYLKGVVNAHAYLQIYKNFGFALLSRAGQIFNLRDENYIPLFKRFYLGGAHSVRGYSEDAIRPADDADWPADKRFPEHILISDLSPSLGGKFLLNVRAELRFPISGNLYGALFFDAGEILNKVTQFSLAAMTMGSGAGIRYHTPLGDLALDVGVKIRDGERSTGNDFSDLIGVHLSFGGG